MFFRKKVYTFATQKEKIKTMSKKKKRKKHNRVTQKVNKPRKMKKGSLTTEEMIRLCDSIQICSNKAEVISYSYAYN